MSILPAIREAIERVGWSRTAELSGVRRETLHRAFGENGRGHPTLTTIEKVLPVIGLELSIGDGQ